MMNSGNVQFSLLFQTDTQWLASNSLDLLLPYSYYLVGGRCTYNNAEFIPGQTLFSGDSNSVTCVVAHTVDSIDQAGGVIKGGPVAATYAVQHQAILAAVQGCTLPSSHEYDGWQIQSVSTMVASDDTNSIEGELFYCYSQGCHDDTSWCVVTCRNTAYTALRWRSLDMPT
jgi:hypothetical protein